MNGKLSKNPKDYIRPLNINGLQGRMMVIPDRFKKAGQGNEILFVYGVHASLERSWGLMQYLARFGRVTMPDLPGFGGMTPFYEIGIKPSFDSYADYLASFIKLRYKGKKITLMAMSYSFSVVIIMLQKYPELKDKINVLISAVGVNDRNNFVFTKFQRVVFWMLFFLCRTPGLTWVMRHIIFRRGLFRLFYRKNHPKMRGFSDQKRNELIDFETYLWHANDVKTYGTVMNDLFNVRHNNIKIPMTVNHIGTLNDQWLKDVRVQDRMNELFDRVVVHISPMKNHGSTVIGGEDEAREIIPQTIEKILKKSH